MKKTSALIILFLTITIIAGCSSANDSGAASQGNKTTDTTYTPQNTTHDNLIGEDQAKSIALAHSGVASDQATFIKTGLDREDNTLVYDLEFYSIDYTEYDYDIDAYTGEVLSYDHDAEYYPDPATDTTIPADAISEAKAKELALTKVPGASEGDIKKFEMDYDNGRLEYEGKIYHNYTEYEFKIDGYTGEFKEWTVETIYD